MDEVLEAYERCRRTIQDFLDTRDDDLSSRIARLQRIVRYYPKRAPLREETARLRFDFECRRGSLVGDVPKRLDAAESEVMEHRRLAKSPRRTQP